MGINTQSGRNAINLVYSAFLGMLYVRNDKNDALVEEAKALVGEDEVKKGYTGKSGSTGKACDFLRENGLDPVSASGKLVHAELRNTEKGGRTYSYVNACVRDDDGLYCISIPAGHVSAQMLTRKLAVAKMGVETTLNVFAMMEKSESTNPLYAGRMFAKHIAMVNQGEEIEGISPAPIQALANEAVAKLKESGIEDTEVISAARKGTATRFHAALWEDINAKVAAYKAARGEDSGSHASDATTTSSGQAVPAGDFDDEIPF